MQNDSATESDSDSATAYEANFDSLPAYLTFQAGHNFHDKQILRKATLEALEQIKKFDLSALQRDATLHKAVLNASNVVLNFLDHCCSPVDADGTVEVLDLFPCLVNAEFLSVLFLHRKTSRTIATEAAIPNAVAAIVCWVDVVLAKISMSILTVASGFSPHPLTASAKFIQSQREEDYVRAATQLPEKWQSIVEVIGSNNMSPAAVRLATRLLFAAHVMRPQLSARKHWMDPSVQPVDVMAAILRNANHKPMNGFSVIASMPRYDEEERANYAMIVSIFSASQTAKRKQEASEPLSPMKIQGLGYLLTILQVGLHGEVGSGGHTTLPYEHLNLAQTILVRWGNLVPWSWATWNDQRIAHVECVADLTITWLYHLNSPFCVDCTSDCMPPFSIQLKSTLSDESNSGAIILQILHRFTRQLREASAPETLSLSFAVVLQKSCAAVVYHLRSNDENRHTHFDHIIQPICQSLLVIFCFLGDSGKDLDIKDLILEALTLNDPATLRSSFQVLREDYHLQFDAKVNEEFARSIRTANIIQADLVPPTTVLTSACLAIKCSLFFLTLIRHSEVQESYVMPRHASLLLSTITNILRGSRSACPSSVMRDAVLTAFAVSGCSCISDDACVIEEDILWDLAVRSEHTNFFAASAFAHRIMVTTQNSDPVSLVEAWDYLRDVLLLILSRRFPEEQEALALLVCPVLCTAMTRMAQTTSPATEFMLSSPWTMNLCSELGSLISAEYPQDARYPAALQQRLRKCGRTLLKQVARKCHRSTALTNDYEVDVKRSCLVFCYAPAGSRLVLVPRI